MSKIFKILINSIGQGLRALPQFRGKDYLARKLLKPLVVGKNIEINVPINPRPLTFSGRIDDWIPWNVYVHGCYMAERHHERFMLRIAASSKIIFDVGANIGYYTLKFAKVSSGKVYAFEPLSYQYGVLKKNLSFNKIEQVEVFKNIVSKDNQTKRIYFSGIENTGASSLIKKSNTFEDIETVSLDSFCTEHSIPHIDLVKIDVEGHEAQVLSGMEGMLKNRLVHHLFVEIHDENLEKVGSSSEEICSYLHQFGYRSYSIKSTQLSDYQIGANDSLVYFTLKDN